MCMCMCVLNFTSSGVCNATTANVPPLSAAHVHACMSWWPGEGCALHFNIPSLTTDICTGFFLSSHSLIFPSHSPSCTITVPVFRSVLWERRITLCKNPTYTETQVLKIWDFIEFKAHIAYPTLKELIENQCCNCCQWAAVRIDRINQGRL